MTFTNDFHEYGVLWKPVMPTHFRSASPVFIYPDGYSPWSLLRIAYAAVGCGTSIVSCSHVGIILRDLVVRATGIIGGTAIASGFAIAGIGPVPRVSTGAARGVPRAGAVARGSAPQRRLRRGPGLRMAHRPY